MGRQKTGGKTSKKGTLREERERKAVSGKTGGGGQVVEVSVRLPREHLSVTRKYIGGGGFKYVLRCGGTLAGDYLGAIFTGCHNFSFSNSCFFIRFFFYLYTCSFN